MRGSTLIYHVLRTCTPAPPAVKRVRSSSAGTLAATQDSEDSMRNPDTYHSRSPQSSRHSPPPPSRPTLNTRQSGSAGRRSLQHSTSSHRTQSESTGQLGQDYGGHRSLSAYNFPPPFTGGDDRPLSRAVYSDAFAGPSMNSGYFPTDVSVNAYSSVDQDAMMSLPSDESLDFPSTMYEFQQ